MLFFLGKPTENLNLRQMVCSGPSPSASLSPSLLYKEKEWRQRPKNCSLEAMGDARAWGAEQRLTADTHSRWDRREDQGKSAEGKQFSQEVNAVRSSLLGKVLLTVVTGGEDPHPGCFPPWWSGWRPIYLLIELTARSPIWRSMGSYNKHTSMQRKPMKANWSQPNPTLS